VRELHKLDHTLAGVTIGKITLWKNHYLEKSLLEKSVGKITIGALLEISILDPVWKYYGKPYERTGPGIKAMATRLSYYILT
jgi:hypothetical protein